MADTYVLVHGAWHTGELLEPTAKHLRSRGHTVHCPTLAGNRPGDDRATVGLADAATSLLDFLEQQKLENVRLVGHSYGGMVISQVADWAPQRIRRLVYINGFVPFNGQCLNDMVPGPFKELFDNLAAANNGALMLPFPIWREVFINDGDLALAESSYARLNPQPYRTFTDPVALRTELAAMPMGKSFVNFQQDVSMPHSMPWHPRLSERLGLFRLSEAPGSHEALFTHPELTAKKIEEAGRD
jgi:pimeloyl-ACP methyl ester carboxylesterase